MKIVVISDIHNQYENISLLKKYIDQEEVTMGICLGDYCEENIIYKLTLIEKIKWFGILGNNDHFFFDNKIYNNFDLYQDMQRDIAIEKNSFLLSHYPVDYKLDKYKKYDIIMHGHTHKPTIEKSNSMLIFNPGELGGRRYKKASFVIFDTCNKKVKFINL